MVVSQEIGALEKAGRSQSDLILSFQSLANFPPPLLAAYPISSHLADRLFYLSTYMWTSGNSRKGRPHDVYVVQSRPDIRSGSNTNNHININNNNNNDHGNVDMNGESRPYAIVDAAQRWPPVHHQMHRPGQEQQQRRPSLRHKALAKPERLLSPRRLLLRDLDAQPPAARQGATRTPRRALPLADDRLDLLRAEPLPHTTGARIHSATAFVPTNDASDSTIKKNAQDPSQKLPLSVSQIATYKIAAPLAEPPLDWWTRLSRTLTWCFFPVCLDACNIHGEVGQQAWREKVTLCIIIAMIMSLVGFFTLGLKAALCSDINQPLSNWALNQTDLQTKPYRDNQVIIQGTTFNYHEVARVLQTRGNIIMTTDFISQDISRLFAPEEDSCSEFAPTTKTNPSILCTVPNPFPGSPALSPISGSSCPSISWIQALTPTNRLFYDWKDVAANVQNSSILFVYNNIVLDLAPLFQADSNLDLPQNINKKIPAATFKLLNSSRGRDVTLDFVRTNDKLALMACLRQRYIVGYVGFQTAGCGTYNVIMSVSLATILGVIFIRFIMALMFHWVVSPKLISSLTQLGRRDAGYLHPPANTAPLEIFTGKDDLRDAGPVYSHTYGRSVSSPSDPYTIMLVTCYSENEASIRGTLDSIAGTDYPDDRKLIVVIADGLIKGDGNSVSTPDAVTAMIQHSEWAGVPEPKGYLAIAHGEKQHNMAKVYVGNYIYRQRPVPIIVIVKCGTPHEQTTSKKPGNRGKRDSQLILINFLSRVTFNDRMTPLDYDIFHKIQGVTGVMPDAFELLLMVDADTFVKRDSLRHMVQTMKNDDRVMGLCGETRIANKRDSWVTMIQVYEYFTSHNLGKAFESLFGGVTCLPGCFCMYRIKSQKGAFTIPLIVNPDVVEEYSENVVDTLHKKNLLLLGEDRFLSTLMLRNFPKRRMVFVPQALCHTTVPDQFRVLLSQRRRWINSTIHNLLELVLLPDLCGIFCFSMQFVIALELIGTIALPAAVTFMYYLLIEGMVTGKPQILPLILLVITLGLPGVLIIITTRKLVYVGWMLVYLTALPVWCFILPLYSFWHFDDFTWGDTRKVEGESKQLDHSNQEGSYKIGSVQLKKWAEWENDRRCAMQLELHDAQLRFRQLVGNDPRLSNGNTNVIQSGQFYLPGVNSSDIQPTQVLTQTQKWPNIHRDSVVSTTLPNNNKQSFQGADARLSLQMDSTELASDPASNHVHFALESFLIPDISEITEEPSTMSEIDQYIPQSSEAPYSLAVDAQPMDIRSHYKTQGINTAPGNDARRLADHVNKRGGQTNIWGRDGISLTASGVPVIEASNNRTAASSTFISQEGEGATAAPSLSLASASYLSAPISHSLYGEAPVPSKRSEMTSNREYKETLANGSLINTNQATLKTVPSSKESVWRVIGPRPMPTDIAESIASHTSNSSISRGTNDSKQTIRPPLHTYDIVSHILAPSNSISSFPSFSQSELPLMTPPDSSFNSNMSSFLQDSTLDESISLGDLADFQFSSIGGIGSGAALSGAFLSGLDSHNAATSHAFKPEKATTEIRQHDASTSAVTNRQVNHSSFCGVVSDRYTFPQGSTLRSDICYSPLDFDDSGDLSLDAPSASIIGNDSYSQADDSSFFTANESNANDTRHGLSVTGMDASRVLTRSILDSGTNSGDIWTSKKENGRISGPRPIPGAWDSSLTQIHHQGRLPSCTSQTRFEWDG
ncbi:hypothetical protein BASA62_007500 [Batrachochytrium salamandrivorans]|nr:hypothetical protein BASA62_007500 [Batrachochytrium salamandrivorans]